MHHSPSQHHSSSQSEQHPTPSYREAKPLDRTLSDLCTTNLEERLYSQAFSLLSSALTSGYNSPSTPAQVPSTEHLALAATLIVHPQLTTRTTAFDKHHAADEALRYLRDVARTAGPRNAHLHEAFRFTDNGASSRGKRAARSRFADSNDNDVELDAGPINSAYARAGSLWSNAEDFWSVVGWAFNCSVVHPARWERWWLFLDLMLDVLHADLEMRLPAAQAAFRDGGSSAVQRELQDCLLTQYLSPIGQGRNQKRRLMRAVVADGSQKSLAEFGEIWRHETKSPKPSADEMAEPVAKRRKLDLENGEFGDYLDDSDEESLGSSLRRSRSVTAIPSAQRSAVATDVEDQDLDEDDDDDEDNDGEEDDDDDVGDNIHVSNGTTLPIQTTTTTTTNKPAAPTISTIGGPSSLHLRQRLLALLTHYCALNPDAFLDVEDLFDLYTEFLRPLPLHIFQHFALPMKPYLAPVHAASLGQMLLRPLLTVPAPAFRDNELLSQDEFEVHYASHAASNANAGDNAKVSLVVEGLLRVLWTGKALRGTARLRERVEMGIAARRQKVALDGRRKVGVKARAEEEAVVVLEMSGERMRVVLGML